MLENILDTKIKIKIAKLFAERDDELQVSDVARILKISKSRASECLRELASKGILQGRAIGRSIIYKPSHSSLGKTIFMALTQENNLLLGVKKTATLKIKKLKPVSFALFGSALRGLKSGSDVDFILLYRDNFKKEAIYEIASNLTIKFGFNVSILPMNAREFKAKARKGEEFVLNVLANHKLLYGKSLEDVVW